MLIDKRVFMCNSLSAFHLKEFFTRRLMREEKPNSIHPISPPVSINGPIREKVTWAEACFDIAGPSLLEQQPIESLLNQFKSASRLSRRYMAETGIVALCRACEVDEGGSCCGKGLENRYDAWLLLINRLLGVNLPHERPQPNGCYFLDKDGCALSARHVICINYVCKKITRKVPASTLNRLRESEGEEIGGLFRLNEAVKQAFKKWMTHQPEISLA